MKPCLLITIYDHGQTVGAVVDGLEPYRLPCIVIDDGSHAETREVLTKLTSQHPWLDMRRFSRNRGRGAALRFGYQLAVARG